MKVNVDQLIPFLKQSQKTIPVFLLSGDEPLQLMEASDAIRKYAQQQGFGERDLLHADAQFDWGELLSASNSLSLFSEKKLIDCRITMKSAGKAGSQAIRDYVNHLPDDKILLIQHPKLAGNARNAAWVKAIDKVGAVIQIWDLSPPQTMAWVAKRMRQQGMHPTPDAVRLLTERIEGNLLAANQEINKLKLLFHKGDESSITEINEEHVLSAVSDSSRYTVFDLSNAVMMGDAHRIQHIHHNLREEGVPVQLVLWILTDLSRQLYNASFGLRNGVPQAQLLSRLPRPRQKPFQVALHRMEHADWPAILQRNSQIDRLSKGQGEIANKGMGRVWSDLLELALLLADKPVIHA